jgi:beta-mannosidase
MNASSGTLKLFLRDRDFNTLAEETVDVTLPPLSASQALVKDFRGLVNTVELERSCFVTSELYLNESSNNTAAGVPVSRETALFVPPKYFSFKLPEYKMDVSDTGDNFTILLKADTFCHFVRLKIAGEDVIFSDNYFDVTGKDAVEILVPKDALKKTYTAQMLLAALTAFSVGESF